MMIEKAGGMKLDELYLLIAGENAGKTMINGWQPMDTAPKNQPILGWCIHDADPYYVSPDENRLIIYGGYSDGLSHVKDGPHVLEWGGGWDDRSYEEPNAVHMPDWWFLSGSDFEVTANPVSWMPIPTYNQAKN